MVGGRSWSADLGGSSATDTSWREASGAPARILSALWWVCVYLAAYVRGVVAAPRLGVGEGGVRLGNLLERTGTLLAGHVRVKNPREIAVPRANCRETLGLGHPQDQIVVLPCHLQHLAGGGLYDLPGVSWSGS